MEQLLGVITVGLLISMLVCFALLLFAPNGEHGHEWWAEAAITGIVCAVLFGGFGLATAVSAEHRADVVAFGRALKRQGFNVVSVDETKRQAVIKSRGCALTLDIANNLKPTIFRTGPDIFFTPRSLAATVRTLPGCAR